MVRKIMLGLSAAFPLGGGVAAYAQTSGGTGSSGTTTSPGASLGSMGSSSSGSQSSSMTEDQVKAKLRAEGYSDFPGVHQQGSNWTATAKKGGQSMQVTVDSSGTVTPASPSRSGAGSTGSTGSGSMGSGSGSSTGGSLGGSSGGSSTTR